MGPGPAGILELNALFVLAGLGLLWGVRGWHTAPELAETLGLALVLGLSAVALVATLILVAGGGLGASTVATCCVAIFVAGGALGLASRRPLPTRLGSLPRPSLPMAVALAGALGTLALVVSFFRLADVMPLGGGDSWEFWVPKAKVIYFDHGIDSPLFSTFAGPRYPLLVPALQAMDFDFMHAAYGPEVAVQYALLYAGFAFAAAAILRRMVPGWIAWLFVCLSALLPQLDFRLLNAQADWPLDLLFALATLVVIDWLRSRERWLLPLAAILLAAVIATKQEGLLLVGCLALGVAAATARRWRSTWPPLAAVALLAYAANLPWRLWWGARRLPVAVPTTSLEGLLHDRARFWPALKLVLQLLFSYGDWSVALPLALLAAAACLTLAGGPRETAVLYLVTCAAGVLAFTWILWTEASLPLNTQQASTPIPRVVGSLALLSIVLAPLLVEPLLRRPRSRQAVRVA